jgi:hypothetical protein
LALGNFCAVNLAAASEQIVIHKSLFSDASQNTQVATDPRAFIRAMLEGLNETNKLVEHSLNVCVRAAKEINAPT